MPEQTTDKPEPLSEQDKARIEGTPSLREAPEPVQRAALGKTQGIDPAQERSALDWFLEPQRALRYRVDVQFDTPRGPLPLTFVLRSIPQAEMERIETRNRKGEGMLAEYDDFQVNVEIVGEALVALEDGNRSLEPNDPAVLSGLPSVAEAMKARFYYQPGLLAGVSSEVRRISGWGSDRVGRAERVLTAASGNS